MAERAYENPWAKYGLGDLPGRAPVSPRRIACSAVLLSLLLGVAAADRPLDEAGARIYLSRQAAYCVGAAKLYFVEASKALERDGDAALSQYDGACLISNLPRCGEYEEDLIGSGTPSDRAIALHVFRQNQRNLRQSRGLLSPAEESPHGAREARGATDALSCLGGDRRVCRLVEACHLGGGYQPGYSFD